MGNDADSWVLCSDGYLRHNKEEMHHIAQLPQEGDTIVRPYNFSKHREHTAVLHFIILQGVSYNHIELNFYLNGQKLDCPFTNVRGQVYPAVYGKIISIHINSWFIYN